MMHWIIWIAVTIYVIGFVFIFWFHITSMPVTPGLALLRALLWPAWIISGGEWPHGTPMPMD
jgi:hypothetical protein